MMKTNFFLRTFRILSLVFFVALLLNACTQEDLAELHSNQAEHNARMHRVSFDEMNKYFKENGVLIPKSLDTTFNKNTDSYITAIDSASITQITLDNITTFTMRINTPDDSKYTFSNLIIELKNGTKEEYIYHYNPTEEWQSSYDAGKKANYEGELTITDIDGTVVFSGKSTIGTFCYMAVDVACYGPSCPCTDGNGQIIMVKIDCGGGSGGGPGIPGDGPTTPTGPGGFNPSEGGGGGNTTTTNTPCQRLKHILDPTKANAKPLITNGMYNYINNSSSGEGGISFKKSSAGVMTSEVLPYTANNFAPVKTGGDYYSAIHTHPKDTYPMFSWSDVYGLYKLEIRSASYNSGNASLLLVCEDDNGVKQTYAITFEDIGSYVEDTLTNPENIGCTDQEIKDKMDLLLEVEYKKEAKKTNPNYERVFLQLNYGTNIGLYKANPSLTGWSKLSINANTSTATVTPTTCN